MCTPICASRYVISIEDRLQPAFFALTSATIQIAIRSRRAAAQPDAIDPRYCPLTRVMSL
jgi:hypothetical protein